MLLRPTLRRRRRRSCARRGQATPACCCEPLEQRRLLTTFTVSSSADTFDFVPGDGFAADFFGATTLRGAIQEANALPGADTINLGAGTYFLNFAGFDDEGFLGDFDITGNLTIVGAGASSTIIDGNDLDRVLHIRPGADVRISGVTIRNGNALNAGGILNEGRLRLTDSIVEDNEVSGDFNSVGGGIGNTGVLALDGVTVRGNSATINGGGLYNSGGAVTAVDTVFSDNTADVDGGGLSIFNGSLTFDGGAITNNTAGLDGGGLSVENGPVTLTEVTVSSNTAGDDGGGVNVFGLGNLQVRSSTISSNTAVNYGGGIYNTNAILGLLDTSVTDNTTDLRGGGLDNDTATTEIINSLFAGNSSGLDGGGITNFEGLLGISNTTLSGNSTFRSGGGLFNTTNAQSTLVNATVTANSAGFGGGIDSGGSLQLGNTLIAENTASASANDLLGIATTLGNNLLGQIDGSSGLFNGFSGDLVGNAEFPLDPLLEPLADNGGPTLSHALQADSPAVDAGRIDGAARLDQTGSRRNRDGNVDGLFDVDIGAVEFVNDSTLFLVNTTDDTFDVFLGDLVAEDFDGNISLRAAVQESNFNAGESRIELPAGVYPLSIAGTDEDFAITGDLDVLDTLTIVGAGQDETFIDAAGLDRVFHVFPGVRLTLIDLTVRNGAAPFGGGIYNAGGLVTLQDAAVTGNTASDSEIANGGGIANDSGILNLERATVSGNSADIDGGGIYSFAGSVNVVDSLIASNAALDAAGGIGQLGGTLDITGTTIELNTATVAGGGVAQLGGLLSIEESDIRDNSAGNADDLIDGDGGGLLLSGATAVVTDSSLTGNSATDDGGGLALFDSANVQLRGVTLSSNSVDGSGGGAHSEGAALLLSESTVSSNTAAASGGGINSESGLLSVRRTTIHSNTAGVDGGGIEILDSSLALRHATVSGNLAEGNGGGIDALGESTADLFHATIVDNTANGQGGGVWSTGQTAVGNSIIARNIGVFQDFAGTIAASANSLIGINNGNSGVVDGVNGNIVGTFAFPFDPVLSALGDFGGPTLAHRPLADSPVIDAAQIVSSDMPMDFRDHRGHMRVIDGDQDGIIRADIGAVEIRPLVFDATIPGNPLRIVRDGDFLQIHDDFEPDEFGNVPRLHLNERLDRIDQIVITGGAFDETVRVDFSGGNPIPGAGLFFDGVGFGGNDTLTISGTVGEVVHLATSEFDGSIEVDGSLISYVNIETLIDLTAVGTRSIDFGSDADTIVVSDDDTTDDGLVIVTSTNVGRSLQVRGLSGTTGIVGSDGDDTLRVESLDSQFTGQLKVEAGAGNDVVDTAAAAVSVTIRAGAGDDTVTTGSGDDLVDGSSGNDVISTGAGNDAVFGGAGGDVIDGGAGDDFINAQGGSGDQLTGGMGDDTLDGGRGQDSIIESGDVDFMLTNESLAGIGNDVVLGIEAARLTGGTSANTINASAFSGRTTLDGAAGDDVLIGGVGNDRLLGRSGNDSIQGGAGNDTLIGGHGNDRLSGGDGNDALNGQMGDDSLLGDDGDDCLFGGGGADTAVGGMGTDTLTGNSGRDVLVAGTGAANTADSGDRLNGLEREIDNLFVFSALWMDASA